MSTLDIVEKVCDRALNPDPVIPQTGIESQETGVDGFLGGGGRSAIVGKGEGRTKSGILQALHSTSDSLDSTRA